MSERERNKVRLNERKIEWSRMLHSLERGPPECSRRMRMERIYLQNGVRRVFATLTTLNNRMAMTPLKQVTYKQSTRSSIERAVVNRLTTNQHQLCHLPVLPSTVPHYNRKYLSNSISILLIEHIYAYNNRRLGNELNY